MSRTTTSFTGSRRLPSVWAHMSGLSLIFVAVGMLVSAAVDAVKGGDATLALIAAAAVTAAIGGTTWRATRVPADIGPKHVFVAVALSWIAMSVAGSLPFIFSGLLPRFDNALFESISGFTCSGSTVLTTEGFESGSPGVMFWRQLTQWFGGMGIIVLAVAVLPFLGVGGLDLIRAEAPGPTSDRLAPRVSETAKRLWLVYVAFTALSIVALMVAGLDWFSASGLALALVSTGGFAPEAASIGAYDSLAVELVLVVGMIIGGASFTLHYNALRGRRGVYLRNSEFRMYIVGIAVGTGAVALLLYGDGMGVATALRAAVFNVVTLATSCGFGNATAPGSAGDFVVWVPAAQVLLLLFMWSGGMTGSTSGGIKVLRMQVMSRIAWRELLRARQPRQVLPITQGNDMVPEEIVNRIAGFVLLYFSITIGATTLLAMSGTDIVTALSGAVSAMGNMGPALGEAGPTSSFLVYSAPERMLLALLMLIGRLEVFPMMLALVVLGQRMRRSRRRVRLRST